MNWPPRKTSLTIVAFVVIAAAPEFVPQLTNYRILDWKSAGALGEFRPSGASTPEADEKARLNPDGPLRSAAVYPLADPNGSLNHFYEALLQTELQNHGAVTKILHYGDSPTTADLITADMRAILQGEFGDAGHGYILPGKPWAWYGHRGFEITSSGWQMMPANQSEERNGLFGLGGVVFRGAPGAVSRLTARDSGHTQIELSYLNEPGGGVFELYADGKQVAKIDTNFPEIVSGFAAFPIASGAREFELRVRRGSPRVFGALFTKPGPGVVYNSLGVNGAHVTILSRMFQEKHWSEQLKHYKPDLVIVNYGTNESVYASFVDTSYTNELRELLRRIRVALPETSILVMSPMDRGQRQPAGDIATVPSLLRLIGRQQKIAAETGCGFFNTFEAMGGLGTMGRWYNAEPRLVSADFIHPMPRGARLVGNLLYRGLINGYHKYKARKMQEHIASAGGIAEKAAATP